jgi:hypothetical protein
MGNKSNTTARTDKSGRRVGGNNPRQPDADGLVRGGEQEGREVRAQSALTTFRRVNPRNPALANRIPNMVCDFQEQRKVIPNPLIAGLSRKHEGYRTMNLDGKPAVALPNVTVGAGEDDKGPGNNEGKGR